jgi:hypothetical protein
VTDRVLVWTGRHQGDWPGGLDAWTSTRSEVASRLQAAQALVLVDPVSFPYPMLAKRYDLPVITVLPADWDAATLDGVLGGPVLLRLTPFDRLLLDLEVDVTTLGDGLSERWEIPDEVWVPRPAGGWKESLQALLADEAGLAERALGKARFVNRLEGVFTELDLGLRRLDRDGLNMPAPRQVSLLGETPYWASRISRRLRARVSPFDDTVDDFGFPLSGPSAVVVSLRDGGQSREERLDMLTRASNALERGGTLLVVGDVVHSLRGEPNPSLLELIEEIHLATGHGIHLEELRSMRWPGESLSRGVLIRATSLRGRED